MTQAMTTIMMMRTENPTTRPAIRPVLAALSLDMPCTVIEEETTVKLPREPVPKPERPEAAVTGLVDEVIEPETSVEPFLM